MFSCPPIDRSDLCDSRAVKGRNYLCMPTIRIIEKGGAARSFVRGPAVGVASGVCASGSPAGVGIVKGFASRGEGAVLQGEHGVRPYGCRTGWRLSSSPCHSRTSPPWRSTPSEGYRIVLGSAGVSRARALAPGDHKVRPYDCRTAGGSDLRPAIPQCLPRATGPIRTIRLAASAPVNAVFTHHRQPGRLAGVEGPGALTVACIPAFAGKAETGGSQHPPSLCRQWVLSTGN